MPLMATCPVVAGPHCTLYFVANSYLVAFALDRILEAAARDERSKAEFGRGRPRDKNIYSSAGHCHRQAQGGRERQRERELLLGTIHYWGSRAAPVHGFGITTLPADSPPPPPATPPAVVGKTVNKAIAVVTTPESNAMGASTPRPTTANASRALSVHKQTLLPFAERGA